MSETELDQETLDAIADAVSVFQTFQQQTYVFMAAYAGWFYYHATTMDDEVSQIWPAPRLKLGKILLLIARYSTTIGSALDLVSFPNYLVLSPTACRVILFTSSTLGILARTSAEGIIWLCLYALLKGKTKYFYLLIAVFLSFIIPIQVLTYINLSSRQAGPLSIFDEQLGWPCNLSQPIYIHLFAAAGYVALTRALVVSVAGVTIVFVRYKDQRNNLITVIRREGGLYLISATVLIFVNGLVTTPGFPGSPLQWIVPSLRWVFVTVFADRLLLQMRKVDDPGTRAVVTTLMFAHDDKGKPSTQDSTVDVSVGEEELNDIVEETRHGDACVTGQDGGEPGIRMKTLSSV